MNKTIVILPGDGIGLDVMPQAVRVLEKVLQLGGHEVNLIHGDIGGTAYEKYNSHFPDETRKICDTADAILFGSVGGPLAQAHLPKWKDCEINSILALRKTYNLGSNLRPAKVYPELKELCPLRQDLVAGGVDVLIIRELVGDIYFGKHERFTADGKACARDIAEYTQEQIENVAHVAFQAAMQRDKQLISVDKANVLDTSKLWREIVSDVAKSYPEVKLEHMLVDNCAMQILINPGQFDVIVTSNLFGDILSDLAAGLPGTLGLMPSASLNGDGFGLYEPSGGSAPDIAGKNIANPIAQILSAAMLLRYSFNLDNEARTIETAVSQVLQAGFRTKDIYQDGMQLVGTVEMTDQILETINLEK